MRRGSLPGLAPLYPPRSLPDLDALQNALAEVLPGAEAGLMAWLDLPPQTNEPMRSAPLIAGLLFIADQTQGLPLALYEVGASAGLILVLDRYRHRLGATTAGAGESPVVIAPEWGASSPPGARLQIARPRGQGQASEG